MAPVQGKIEASPPSFTLPIAEPAPKDQKTMRVELVAIPMIAIVAAFMLLSLKAALVITAIVTVGAVMYLRREKPAEAAKPAAPEETPAPSNPEAPTVGKPSHTRIYTPKADGEFANVIFNFAEDAERFQTACQDRFSEFLECCDSGVDELNKVLYFKPATDADTRGQIAEAIRLLIQ
jgi:hypothetical protein